ncbi:unnamed protein product [Periconia digitata]|uniref:Non-homologous end-joining factor 1 n=1 Tax=Periconia digitata TaxID=1303443 RepID=A0A9W4UGS0_9PLEO|nr:unnamed protein product [Periconia digitata]
MSFWRPLQLSDEFDDAHIPHLLVKPQFETDSYTVFLTDLTNIWSEQLDLAGIVQRALVEKSPIEVSKQDTAQLTILLDNVQKPLLGHQDATCRVTKTPDATDGGVVLHTTIALPKPLDSLQWKFHLRKRSPATLRNELILPLLMTSQIQHESIHGLIAIISEKDKVITRMTDQFESSNMDLAAAFPSIGIKSRKIVKREQAAKHVPGLRPFDKASWQSKSASLQHEPSTLDVFQEALSHCTPKIPPSLNSDDEADNWWSKIDSELKGIKPRRKEPEPPSRASPASSETDDDETEDEFETHDNFKARQPQNNVQLEQHTHQPSSSPKLDQLANDATTDEEDDDDLDAPVSRSQTRKQSQSQARGKEPSSPNLIPPKVEPSPPQNRDTRKPFRIGGKGSRSRTPSIAPEEVSGANDESTIVTTAHEQQTTTLKAARKPFKIGGKAKAEAAIVQDAAPVAATVEQAPQVEDREETAEEKAERKRQELKRRNEDLAKKQVQSKKKRRF